MGRRSPAPAAAVAAAAATICVLLPGGVAVAADPGTTPRPVTVALATPAQVAYGNLAGIRVSVTSAPDPATSTSADPVPVAGEIVTISEETSSGWTPLRLVSTNASGVATAELTLPVGVHHLEATVDADPDANLAAGTSTVTSTTVTRAATRLTVSNATIASEQTAHVTVRLTSVTDAADTANAAVVVRTRRQGTGGWASTRTWHLGANGSVTVPVTAWRTNDVDVTFAGTTHLAPAHAHGLVATRSRLPVVNEGGRPRPRIVHPVGDAPQGAGANASIGAIPNAVWASMVGVSWTRGCPVGRAGLRYVSVNYWGFDGYRYRGHIIVSARIAGAVAGAFGDLYGRRFRIRSMHPEDVYGRDPRGPGANDYASMAADNTSGFNCRYVVGKEGIKDMSPHAYGLAIDVNTSENPYVAPTGVFPDRWYLTHRSGAGVITPSIAQAFTSRGLFWGAHWAHPDIQHFELD